MVSYLIYSSMLCRNKPARYYPCTVPYISKYVYSWAEHTIIIIATYIWRVNYTYTHLFIACDKYCVEGFHFSAFSILCIAIPYL